MRAITRLGRLRLLGAQAVGAIEDEGEVRVRGNKTAGHTRSKVVRAKWGFVVVALLVLTGISAGSS